MNRKRVMLVAGALGAVVLALPSCTSSKPGVVVRPRPRRRGCHARSGGDHRHRTVKSQQGIQHCVPSGRHRRPFYITMQCGAQEEAAKLGVKVSTQGPQKFDPTLQKPILDSIVASKPDALLVAPHRCPRPCSSRCSRRPPRESRWCSSTPRPNDPSYAVSEIASRQRRAAAGRHSKRSRNCGPRAARSW